MQKKTLLIIVFLSVILLPLSSSCQIWYWTKQADSSSLQTASQVTVDRNNNPVYTGYFTGTRMAFGNIGIGTTAIQSDFLVKYSANGNPLWARSATALDPSVEIDGMSVATDRNNDVLESGYYSDSIAFGAYHLGTTNTFNTFLAKYDGAGNVLWAVAPPFISYINYNYGVTTDKRNNIYITGYFSDTIVFGHDTLASVGTDMYLVKYDPNGNVLWAVAPVLANASSTTYGLSVAADDSGNAYVAGNVYDSAYFGPIKIGATGNGSVYIAKFDSAGHAKWAMNTTATPNQVLPTPVKVDRSNNVYLGAQFTNLSITFGAYTVTNGSTDGASNALLVKYTPMEM